jgi:hypothetical protein
VVEQHGESDLADEAGAAGKQNVFARECLGDVERGGFGHVLPVEEKD